MPRLLTVAQVPDLLAEERALLDQLVAAGARLLAGFVHAPPELAVRVAARANFLYRRWLLELLLLLRVEGPSGFNELARALGGLAGESLAPKLHALQGARLVDVVEAPGRPRRSRYVLTPAGERLGGGVYALAIGKAEHARAVQEGGGHVPVHVDPAVLDVAAVEATLNGVAHLARRFTDLHARHRRPEGLEAGLVTARRFARSCVHKWHGPVLFALATRGPMRFRDLGKALGAGGQALSNVLAELVEEFCSVERLPGPDPRYAVTHLGRFDLSLGVPLLLLVPEPLAAPAPLQTV